METSCTEAPAQLARDTRTRFLTCPILSRSNQAPVARSSCDGRSKEEIIIGMMMMMMMLIMMIMMMMMIVMMMTTAAFRKKPRLSP